MPDEPTSSAERDGRRLPDQVTMGLLPYLTTHALDEDYAHAAERRRVAGDGQTRGRFGPGAAIAVAVFALLAVTAAAQTSRNSVSEEREHQALVAQVTARKTAVEADRRTVTALQAENRRLDAERRRTTSTSSGVLAQLRLLALRSGTSEVHGPGVEIMVDDAVNAESDRFKVLDTDLQKIVNGLWRAGAEAISINGERLTSVSAIRSAGGAITVNFTRLSRPYRILAIGDRDTLPARFAETTSGQAWFDAQRGMGLQFASHAKSSLRLPAAEVPTLRYATSREKASGRGLS